MLGITATLAASCIRWGRSSQTSGGCVTCTATSGSGSAIGTPAATTSSLGALFAMRRATASRLPADLSNPRARNQLVSSRARAGSSAAARGTAAPASAALAAARDFATDRLALQVKGPVLVGRSRQGLSLCGYRVPDCPAHASSYTSRAHRGGRAPRSLPADIPQISLYFRSWPNLDPAKDSASSASSHSEPPSTTSGRSRRRRPERPLVSHRLQNVESLADRSDLASGVF
jgi:hypothetical protein